MPVKDLLFFWKRKTEDCVHIENPSLSFMKEMTGENRERKITIVSLSSSQSGHLGDHDIKSTQPHSKLNLDDVISEIENNFEIENSNEKAEAHLKKCISQQAKELVWFFSTFVIYIIFGMFLFFYIEECSGASKPNDDSYKRDISEKARYKNITDTCAQLFKLLNSPENVTIYNKTAEVNKTTKLLNKSTTNVTLNNDFKLYGNICTIELTDATVPVLTTNATVALCLVDEYQLLKYAEFTIFTCLTIGYGNTTPETIIGRVTLMVYALFGIPLALTLYSVAGKLVVQIITLFIRVYQRRILKRETEVRHLQFKTLAVSLCLFCLIILIGSAVTSSSEMEDLDFSSSVYFWFISLSTIGYGDITFKRDQHLKNPHLMMVATGNLLFGLGILAAIIEALSLALEKRDLQMSTIIIDESGSLDNEEEYDNSADTVNYEEFSHQDAMHKYTRAQELLNSVDQEEATYMTDLSSKDSSLNGTGRSSRRTSDNDSIKMHDLSSKKTTHNSTSKVSEISRQDELPNTYHETTNVTKLSSSSGALSLSGLTRRNRNGSNSAINTQPLVNGVVNYGHTDNNENMLYDSDNGEQFVSTKSLAPVKK